MQDLGFGRQLKFFEYSCPLLSRNGKGRAPALVMAARAFAAALLVLALLCGAAFAQETTGSVRGTVMDPTGATIPGATVELSGGNLPRPFTATTDSTGSFRFGQVPPGTAYALTITAQGFRVAKAGGLNVELGKAATIDTRLEIGGVAETVEVSAQAVMVDTQSSSSAVTVDKSFFDLIPKGRSFYDLIGIAPGARNETKAGGYEIDGASGSENVYFLDGMEVTNIQTGVLSDQNRIPTEMVQQIEVKNGVMEAQYGGAMGGVVNAVVRSGGNDFHGQAGFYFNNDVMQSRPRPYTRINPINDNIGEYVSYCGPDGKCGQPMDAYRAWEPVFNVSGPLIRNKLFFFSAYEPTTTSTDRHVNFNAGQVGDYSNKSTQQYLSNKVDFAPFSKFRMNTSWVWNPTKTTGLLPGRADSVDSPWAQRGEFRAGNIISGQVDYLATSSLILSFRGGYNYSNYNNNYAIPPRTAIYTSSTAGIAGLPAMFQNQPEGWLVQAVGFTKYDIYTRKNYNADASYTFNFHGQHNLKGGWQMNKLGNDVFNTSYPYGYYRYYWNKTYRCVTSQCTTGRGAYGYYRYRVLGTVGLASSENQGIFIQDNWRVNRHLTLNLGLRTEREFLPAFASAGSNTQPVKFSWGEKMSPRIGGAFDIKGDGKQRVYASFGYFYDVMKYEMPRGSFGGDVWKEWYFTLDDPNVAVTNQGFPADPTKLPGTFLETVNWRIPSNDPSQHLLDPNLKPVQQRMLDIGYDYSISSTLVASARYTNRRLIRTIEDTGYMGVDGETYLIANPGEGFTLGQNWLNIWQGVVVPTPPKPVRKYDALELRLDKRFARNYQFAASYIYSRLWGNYSGLASSDEDGRNSPNVNRYYDMPWVGVMQNGKYAYGDLATDRPHTFKLFGGYTLRSKAGETTFAPVVSLFSGIPITTEANLVSSTPAFPFGRGDLGRTPTYFNSDVSVMHDFMPFKSRESMRVRLQLQLFNLFNSTTATNKSKRLLNANDGQIQFNDANGDPDYPAIFKGFNARQLMQDQGIRQDPLWGWATTFQGPRSLRLQVSFFF